MTTAAGSGAVLPAAARTTAGARRRWHRLLQVRRAEDSVHGAGRSLTNRPNSAALQAFGGRELLNLEVVGPTFTVVEQVEAHGRAEVVIGTHGAGFANTLWAPAGCPSRSCRSTYST